MTAGPWAAPAEAVARRPSVLGSVAWGLFIAWVYLSLAMAVMAFIGAVGLAVIVAVDRVVGWLAVDLNPFAWAVASAAFGAGWARCAVDAHHVRTVRLARGERWDWRRGWCRDGA